MTRNTDTVDMLQQLSIIQMNLKSVGKAINPEISDAISKKSLEIIKKL